MYKIKNDHDKISQGSYLWEWKDSLPINGYGKFRQGIISDHEKIIYIYVVPFVKINTNI